MFEQSILIDHATGKRTGALAASVMVQSLGLGILLVIPLIYNERLPILQPFIPLSMPVLSPAPVPPAVETTSRPSEARSILSTARRYVPPTRIPSTSPMAPVIGDVAEPQAIFDGPIGGPLLNGLTMPQVIAVAPAAPQVVPPKVPTKPVVVSGGVQAAKLIKQVVPAYPALAKQARISGTVRIVGVIAKDGTIQQLQLVSGHPLLAPAAMAAVRQWVYRPTLLNGEAVEVIAPIDVIFTLSQ